MRKVIKEFIKLFGPLAIAICVSTVWFVHSRNANNRKAIERQQENLVTLETESITSQIAARASDARFLARLVSRRLGHKLDSSTLRNLEDDFADFARNRSDYFQVRFLDSTGLERIRLERSFAGPVIIPESSLQDKSGRYYFQRGFNADRDDVYISHFDLNIEKGIIEVPHKPTIRYMCPVIDPSGNKRGVIALNYDGSALLQQLDSRSKSGPGQMMLITGDGNWMLGPSVKDAWGHILKGKKGSSMASRFPKAWPRISSYEKGLVLTSRGLFTFDTVDIIPGELMFIDTPSAEQRARRWKVVSRVAPDMLTVPWMYLFTGLVILFNVMLSLGCWHLAQYRVRQEEVETRLRENEERTLAISQSSQDAIAMVDDQDQVTYWNPSAEKLLGYTASEMVGSRLHGILAPEELRPAASKGFTTFTLTGNGEAVGNVLEFEAVHKNGSLIPVELAVASFYLKGRWYAVGSMRDITRRKRDEAELIRSNEINWALINAPTESATLIERDGTLVAINKVAAERLGVDPKAVIGRCLYDITPPELAETQKGMAQKVFETGEPVRFEDSRNNIRLENNLYPCKGQNGTVDRIAIFSRDVSAQHKAKLALMQSEQRFRDVSEAVGEFIWETDAMGRLQFLTEDVESVIGYSTKEMLGKKPSVYVGEDDAESFAAWRKDVMSRHDPFTNIEFSCRTKEGDTVWLQASGVPFFSNEGLFLGYRGAAMDVTGRRKAEDAIKASERKLRALAESAYDAIIMIDTNGMVSFWNDAATELFGYSEEEAMGQDVHTLIAPPELCEQAQKALYGFAMTGKGLAVGKIEETVGVHKDGTEMPIERSVSGFRLGDEWYAVATIRDISKRKETEAALTRLATTDGLTGLNNRRRFMELAESEFARSVRYGRPLSLFMLDIDHFKKVNDTHGHDVGDIVLRTLSKIAALALRNADILGRLGGEEFGVILPETGGDAARDVAERLRASVENNGISTNVGEIRITISIGVSTLQPNTTSVQEMLKHADVALYEAKQSGRNRIVFG